MPIRKTSFISEEYYHIYNRGNSKQKIFHDKEDYERFIGLLYACNQVNSFKIDTLSKDQGLLDIVVDKKLVSIGAYTLMPNHFHILITQTEDEGVSKFMRKIMTSYVMYYNRKYERTGSLFEGRFKSGHANTDRYLKYLFSYIHLNPVKLIDPEWKEKGIKDKQKTVNFLNNYAYSSFVDFSGKKRIQNKILNIRPFPKYFPEPKDFIREIMTWINFR